MEKPKTTSNSKILIAAGGTGGHLFPAQSLALELQRNNRDMEVFFAGAGLKTNRYFNKEKFLFEEISSATFFRSKRHLFKSMFSLLKGIKDSFKLLKQLQPDLVVGFGSFHSFPILAAAYFQKIPIVLFEPNSEPGKVNRLFSRWAAVSAVQFSEAASKMKGFTVEVKMPVWKNLEQKNTTVEEARAHFNFSEDLLTLLVFGGSQGSIAINAVFCETASLLHDKGVPFRVIHITGKNESSEKVRDFYFRKGIQACVKEFEEQMHLAWQIAHLVISRAGAATLAEQIAFEVPGILIPYPFATDQHQKKNALVMQDQIKAAVCLLEEDCDAERLTHEIEKMIEDRQQFDTMRRNIRLFKEKEGKRDLHTLVCNLLGRPSCRHKDIISSE